MLRRVIRSTSICPTKSRLGAKCCIPSMRSAMSRTKSLCREPNTSAMVCIRPVISERSYNLIETEGQYTFQVDKRANKNQIKRAVESAFDVSVARVNTANVKSKPKRQGLTRGRTATWKKAVVKLAPGESIELFEGV